MSDSSVILTTVIICAAIFIPLGYQLHRIIPTLGMRMRRLLRSPRYLIKEKEWVNPHSS